MSYQDKSRQDNDLIRDARPEMAAMRGPHYRRDDMMSALGDAVRENPVPAALIGMGALWLFMGGANMSLFGGGGRASLMGSMAHGAADMAHDARGMARTAAQSVSRMGSSLASGVSSTVGGLAETVGDAAGRVGDVVGSTLHGVDARQGDRNPAFSRAAASASDMTAGLRDMLERNPMALGVAGLALGAAAAASLPLTSTERDALGRATDTVRSKLGDVAAQARDIASAAVDEVSRASSRGPG